MATMLAYGFFGNIIEQSSNWRCLGPLRYDLAGFCQFIRHPSYHSELTITLSSHDRVEVSHLETKSNGSGTSAVAPDNQQLLNNKKSTDTIEKIVKFCSKNCGKCAEEENIDLNNVHLPLQIKLEGRYTTINCLNMPCRCAKSKYGMSPFVHLGKINHFFFK
jgi:ceramide kinase